MGVEIDKGQDYCRILIVCENTAANGTVVPSYQSHEDYTEQSGSGEFLIPSGSPIYR
jgi:hypothetical protein